MNNFRLVRTQLPIPHDDLLRRPLLRYRDEDLPLHRELLLVLFLKHRLRDRLRQDPRDVGAAVQDADPVVVLDPQVEARREAPEAEDAAVQLDGADDVVADGTLGLQDHLGDAQINDPDEDGGTHGDEAAVVLEQVRGEAPRLVVDGEEDLAVEAELALAAGRPAEPVEGVRVQGLEAFSGAVLVESGDQVLVAGWLERRGVAEGGAVVKKGVRNRDGNHPDICHRLVVSVNPPDRGPGYISRGRSM